MRNDNNLSPERWRFDLNFNDHVLRDDSKRRSARPSPPLGKNVGKCRRERVVDSWITSSPFVSALRSILTSLDNFDIKFGGYLRVDNAVVPIKENAASRTSLESEVGARFGPSCRLSSPTG